MLNNPLFRFFLAFSAYAITKAQAFSTNHGRNWKATHSSISVLSDDSYRSSSINYQRPDGTFFEKPIYQDESESRQDIEESERRQDIFDEDQPKKRRKGPNTSRRQNDENTEPNIRRDILSDEDRRTLIDEMAESLDLTRETHRLESLSSYIVVSALTGTCAFATLQELNIPENPSTFAIITYNLGIGASCISALSGMYSTVIFSLSSTYGLTAIGMRKDSEYETFMSTTGSYRYRAFQAYMTSLSTFLLVLVLFGAEKMEESLRYPFLSIFVVLALVCWKDWTAIIESANPIFAPPPDTEEE